MGGAILVTCFICVFVCGMTVMELIRHDRERQATQATNANAASDASARDETPSGDSGVPEDETHTGRESPRPASADGSPALPQVTRLDLTELSKSLFAADDPIGWLRHWTRETTSRMEDQGARVRPGALEEFLSRSLDESGIFDPLLDQASVSVVRPSTSGLFYLRVNVRELPYATMCRVLAVEGALNGALLASGLVRQDDDLRLEDVYLTLQALDARIVAQASRTPQPASLRTTDVLETLEPTSDGEWAARMAISRDIECLKLPYRLRARFRLNQESGDAAVEFDYTPPEVLRASCCVEGVGVVPRSHDMLEQEAGAYALRVGLLLARRVLEDCPRLRRVWMADNHDTPSAHVCHFWGVFERDILLALDPSRDFDPYRLCLALGITMNVRDRTLLPVRQGFALDDERFCPSRRFDAPELSDVMLPSRYTDALGAKGIADLGVREDAGRLHAADEILRLMDTNDALHATEQGVRAVMAAAASTGLPGIDTSARRCARKLVEGSLAPDPWAVAREFCASDLHETLRRATTLIEGGGFREAADLLEREVLALDLKSIYQDDGAVAWRCFNGYADRVVYNRLLAPRGVVTRLAPDDYLETIVTLSTALLWGGDAELACRYARRACHISPASTRERLHLIRCLEALGRSDAVKEQANVLLTRAHDAEALGWGYYSMAHALWAQGDVRAAQASYQRAMSFMPSLASIALAETSVLSLLSEGAMAQRTIADAEVVPVLEHAGVVIAPTPQMTLVLMEAARAATDAEVFPVAHELTFDLGAILHDDIVFGVLRSFEGAPDR